ncbi:MAG: hydrogenase nickel incorporation protein HypB [Planctomycetota bacterium]
MKPKHMIAVKKDLREKNLAAARAFREQMTERATLVVRLVSSPGSGKTSLLEATLRRLASPKRVSVLVGDVETDRDGRRLAPLASTRQITTGGACHLEFPLVADAYAELPHQTLDYLFIEDIGNLICPASHDLGEHLRIVLHSVTEGDDKPGKYPKMFRTSDAVVISKIDLLPHVPFSIADAIDDAQQVQPDLAFLPLSAATGQGLEPWLDYLTNEHSKLQSQVFQASER